MLSQNTTTTTAVPLQNSSSTTAAFSQNSTTTTSLNSITTDPYTTTTSPNLITTDPYTTTTSPDRTTTDPFNGTDTDPDGVNTDSTSTNSSTNASHKLNTGEAVGVGVAIGALTGIAIGAYGHKKYSERDAEESMKSMGKRSQKDVDDAVLARAILKVENKNNSPDQLRKADQAVTDALEALKEFKNPVSISLSELNRPAEKIATPKTADFENKYSRNLSNSNVSFESREPEENAGGTGLL
ncbi:hypothetical protein [Polaromonas vacuolata]|uniref:hypothetical protein n=1 Tax=Polaromonas vacuolata TaxID=37448 RepID=UPI001456F2B2|nr:hypothetical protein [Polaromonas vacuolata]